MKLVNRKFLCRSSFFLFFLACSEDELTTITHTAIDLPPPGYKLNLQSTNSGISTNTVTITWDSIEADSIYINSGKITPDGNSQTFDMMPGEFRDISIEVFTIDSIYVDDIQIYTRSVYPVTYFTSIAEQIIANNTFFDFNDLNQNGRCEYTGNVLLDNDGNLQIGDFESAECEPFYDGNQTYDLGEDFDDGGVITQHDSIDPNQNGICDFTGSVQIDEVGNILGLGTFSSQECEPFNDGNIGVYDSIDPNQNGICDFTGSVQIDEAGNILGLGTFSSQECEPFNDGNIGVYDSIDPNQNGICDFTGSGDNGTFSSQECEPFMDGNILNSHDFFDLNGDGICNYTITTPEDLSTFSSQECEPFIDSVNKICDSWEEWQDSNGVWDHYADLNNNGICEFTGNWENGTFSSQECEPFQDGNGQYNVGEEFDDSTSGNGNWDPWENYQDGNGEYDIEEDFQDGNDVYDFGEVFIDSEDGVWNTWENFTDSNNGSYDSWEYYQDGNGVYNFGEVFIDSEIGDYTSWEQFIDSLNTDGVYDIWEEFTDSEDGVWNTWENFTDSNNGSYDPWETYEDGNDIYDLGETFIDENQSGEYDFGEEFTDIKNGSYDLGEDFQDGNGVYDLGEDFIDGNGVYNFGEVFIDSEIGDYTSWEQFIDSLNTDGVYDIWEEFTDSDDGVWNTWEYYQDGNGVYDFGEVYEDGNDVYDFGEEFTDSDDGVWNIWENFTDSNNGSYDPWESFDDGNIGIYDYKDLNRDGICNYTITTPGDLSTFSSQECEPFIDSVNKICDSWEEWQDSNGVWDHYVDNDNGICDFTGSWENGTFSSQECEPFQDGNGQYNVGEEFDDSINNIREPWEEFIDSQNNIREPWEKFVDSDNRYWEPWEKFVDSDNGFWEPWEKFVDSGNHIREAWEEFIDEPSLRNNIKLNWTVTEEETFLHYIIYRVTKENGDLLKNLSTCNCQIDNLPANLDTIGTNVYIETDSILTQTVAMQPVPASFYYRIQVVTNEGYTRDSYIHYSGFDQPESITLTENDVSTDRDEYVEIKWTSIAEEDSNYIYQYEIWRSSNEVISDTSRVIIIPSWKIDHFWDRDVGSGTSWYYSVAIRDINDRISFSNFIRGWAKP